MEGISREVAMSMTRKEQKARHERIAEYIRLHPTDTYAEVGKVFGVSSPVIQTIGVRVLGRRNKGRISPETEPEPKAFAAAVPTKVSTEPVWEANDSQ